MFKCLAKFKKPMSFSNRLVSLRSLDPPPNAKLKKSSSLLLIINNVTLRTVGQHSELFKNFNVLNTSKWRE